MAENEKAAKALLPTPEDVSKGVVKALPASVGSALLTIYSVFQWVSVPTSLLSQLTDLKMAADFWRSLYSQAIALRPLLDAIFGVFAPVLEAWRAVTRPLVEAFERLLPSIVVPHLVVDLIVIALICAPSIVRMYWLRASAERWLTARTEGETGAWERLNKFVKSGGAADVLAPTGLDLSDALLHLGRDEEYLPLTVTRSFLQRVSRLQRELEDHLVYLQDTRGGGDIHDRKPTLILSEIVVQLREVAAIEFSRLRAARAVHRARIFLHFAAGLSAIAAFLVCVDLYLTASDFRAPQGAHSFLALQTRMYSRL